MGRIRVCQLLTELRPAGAERAVRDLVCRLAADRFDMHVIGLRGGSLAADLRECGIACHSLNVRGRWDALKLRALAGLLAEHRFDILHTHLFHADLAGRLAAQLAGVRHVVHTVHAGAACQRPWHYGFARVARPLCERIVCISESVLENHRRRSGLPAGAYALIRYGFDPAEFSPSPADRRRLRAEWAVGHNEPVVAYVGRLASEKGIDVFLAALSHLAGRGKPLRAVIAGDGPLRGMVDRYRSHGIGQAHCRWLGHVQDVRAVYSAADMLAMPSRTEGFGRSAAEAMLAELPVVATGVGGLREVIIPNTTGLLLDGPDGVALAEGLFGLAGAPDLRRRMGQAGARHIREQFGMDEYISAHEELYEQVAGGC